MKRVFAVLACSLAACSYLGTARDFDPAELDRDNGWIAVRGVPLMLQEQQIDCGAAAMAMILSYWKTPATVRDVLAACPPVPRQGIRAGQLVEYARSRGFKAFVFQGRWKDLHYEISKSRPVMVGVVKPTVAGGLAHYEVVVALHPAAERIVTLDPARGWRVNSYEGFEREWAPSRRVTLVVFR